MYDMKKTENGWELWSQLGNPTEHLVATVEKEPVARKLMGILADQDDTPPKTAYVEMVGDFNLDDPEYAEYRVDADLVREVTAVFTAISAFGLSEARRYTNAVVWHGADTWITGDEIAAGGCFWMTAHPKHGGDSFETQGMTLEEVVEILLCSEEVVYVASDMESLKELVEDHTAE